MRAQPNPMPTLKRLAWWAVCGLVLWAAPALAQDPGPDPALDAPQGVVGRVFFESVPAGSDNPGNASFYWRVPAAGLVHDGARALPLDQLTVVLTGGAAPSKGGEARVALRGYQPHPRTLVVAPGTALRFSNEDPHPYRLEVPGRDQPPVSLAEAGQEGSAQEVTLDRAGRFVFMDPRMPSASLYVVVARVTAASGLVPDGPSEARFELGALPPGRYRMEMYFRGELLKGMSRDVEVDAQGALNPPRFLIKREDF